MVEERKRKKEVDNHVLFSSIRCWAWSLNTPGKRTPKLKADIKVDGKVVKKKGEIIHENEWNRAVAKYCAAALKRCGINTYYTADMTGEVDTPLSTRATRANNKKCDILVSFHYNAYGICSKFLDETKYKGGLLVLRTKNCSSNSIKLGELIAKQLNNDIDYRYSYGLRRDVDISGFTLAILRQTNMPAVLVEYGFMDIWSEAKLMCIHAHQKACGESTAKAICKYFGVKYVKETTIDNTTTNTTTNEWKNGDYNCKVKATANLNLRKGRGTDYEVIYTIPKGTVFEVGYVLNDWGSTWDFKDQVGYISMKYVEKV